MNTIFKRLFQKGYNRKLSTSSNKEEIKRLLFYMLRWQLSTPILAFVTLLLVNYNQWFSAFIANLVGSLIFYWVDKIIFKPQDKKE